MPAKKQPKTAKPDPTENRGDALLWTILDRVRTASRGDLERSIRAFRAELKALEDVALLAVEASFSAAMRRAYDWNLWGAAFVIHGGCSDDAFWDFRAGLVALGQKVYEAALRDPDSLAAIEDIEDLTLFEGFQYVPSKLLEERGLESTGGGHSSDTPSGAAWTEDELERRFPRLSARFG